MKYAVRTISNWWIKWGAPLLAAIFVIVIMWMISLQYATFDTRAADLDRFIQAIWNTANGRFLYATIEDRSILSGHFSPFLVLLAPLLWIWPDPRILSLVQTIGLAAAGIFLYKIVHRKYPTIAPWFLLAFFLNPALHELALLELRRVTFAVPFIAMALYALSAKNRRLLAVGLFLALLCKENVALVMVMVGVYLLLFERDRRWGILLIVVGIAWLLMVLFWINPALDPKAVQADSGVDAYRGLRYFSGWGDSFLDILINVMRQPWIVLQTMFDQAGVAALWRIFLPLGIVLPFLSPSIFLMAVPSLGYMLLSGNPAMHQLQDWYMGTILPTLFAAIGVGLTKRTEKQARGLTAVLLLTTLIGYAQYSYAPFGGKYNPIKYERILHHQRATEIVDGIPPDAAVAATSAFTPRLAQRSILYLYPWIPKDAPPMDYILIDRYLKSYPLNEIERNDDINNLLADPTMIVEKEVDGIFLFKPDGLPLPGFTIGKTAEEAIHLERIELSPANESGYYEPAATQPIRMQPGQAIRVSLYWRALKAPQAERTVSVRISDAAGSLVAQHDMQPSNGARPTSWWEPGWTLRDVYYLTVSPGAQAGPASLSLVLYDSYSHEIVSFDNHEEILTLSDLTIEPVE